MRTTDCGKGKALDQCPESYLKWLASHEEVLAIDNRWLSRGARTLMHVNKVQQALDQLSEIDAVIKQDSESPRAAGEYDRFMSLVHQKEGLIDLVRQESGHKPHWTPNGYELA